MRFLAATLFILGSSAYMMAADDKDNKLDEKFLVGKWNMKSLLNGKEAGKLKLVQTIEFKDDKTFMWDNAGFKTEGTYALNGTTLELTKKGENKPYLLWKDLSIKDDKIVYPVTKTRVTEFSRADKDK
jgi:uncharacterized protein (TIGR03066 family)